MIICIIYIYMWYIILYPEVSLSLVSLWDCVNICVSVYGSQCIDKHLRNWKYAIETFLHSSCLGADPLREVACSHQEIPSLGSYGHPSICRRPCILFIRGTCKKAADCGFCHLHHVTLQDLSKLPFVCFFGNPFLLIRENCCTVLLL